jgi:TonB family protein
MKNKYIILALSFVVLGGGLATAAPENTVITAPEALKIVQPEAPVLQSRMGLSDTVTVTFQINEEGRPVKIKLEAYDNENYAKAVESAVRKWRFKAPSVSGVTYSQTIRFS